MLRTLSLCTCCRHYPGAASGRIVSLSHPAVSAFPERVVGSACASSFSRFAQRLLFVAACTLALSPIRDTHSGRRESFRKNLHAQGGAVLGVYPPVHPPASPAARGSRHPAIFLCHTAFSSPNGVDARTCRLHQKVAEGRSQYRTPRRSKTSARATVTSDSTGQNHCDEVLAAGRGRRRCGLGRRIRAASAASRVSIADVAAPRCAYQAMRRPLAAQ